MLESRVGARDSPWHGNSATGHLPVRHHGRVFDAAHLVRSSPSAIACVAGGHFAIAHRRLIFDVSHLVGASVAFATGGGECEDGEAQRRERGCECLCDVICFHGLLFC